MIKIKELLINGVDYSDYATIPLQTQETLDESLDVSYIELKGLEIENPFLPFSDVDLILEEGDVKKEYTLFVESDNPIEIISHKVYDHNLLLIEETKWSERFFVEKSITNPITKSYVFNASVVYPSNVVGLYPSTNKNILTPKENGSKFTVPSVAEIYDGLISDSELFLGTGALQVLHDGVEVVNSSEVFESPTITLGMNSTYEIKYTFTLTSGEINSCSYFFETLEEDQAKKEYKIKDTINILLETVETLRVGETPKFRLASVDEYNESEEYKEKVLKILETKTPDFYFPKMSLFEALKTVGNYGHFIPRIRNRKIYLDLLGMSEQANLLEDYMSNTSTLSSNDFCTKLDSQVGNLVNLDSNEQGSVTTPFNDGYRTLRAETGIVQITDQNFIIPTESAIEKIVKLELGYLPSEYEGKNIYIGDITDYVYESAEYNILSSYTKDYPRAKAYALKYTIGSNNITDLQFKPENVLDQSLESSALVNIIKKKLGMPDFLIKLGDLYKIQYRLTYIPNTETRITQVKSYKDNINKTIAIAYNQSASKISSNAYGENLKGQVLKMGNIEKQKMFILPSIDLIPKCGQKFDEDYYISVVKCEYYPNFVRCEVGLSKDYNNKSAYVEVDSQLRFYDISEKIPYNVYRIYEDYCEIGFDSNTDNMSLITEAGINKFANSFNGDYQDVDVTMVKATSIFEKNPAKDELSLPVTSLGIGNSIMFGYHYVDNYSAGNIAQYEGNTRVQIAVPYVDGNGEVEKLDLKFGKNTTNINTYEKAVEIGDILPYVDDVEMEVYFDTDDKPIILKKDNREAIHFTYQMHFVANNNNIIIGSGLARYSPFVTSEKLRYKLVLLKNKLSKFESEIDLSETINEIITVAKTGELKHTLQRI